MTPSARIWAMLAVATLVGARTASAQSRPEAADAGVESPSGVSGETESSADGGHVTAATPVTSRQPSTLVAQTPPVLPPPVRLVRVPVTSRGRFEWALPSAPGIYRVIATKFHGGGRCKAWLRVGPNMTDLSQEGVTVDGVADQAIQLITCDRCEPPSSRSCSSGTPPGAWPTTASGENQVSAAASYEIAPGVGPGETLGYATFEVYRLE